jgi:hypothetical protein
VPLPAAPRTDPARVQGLGDLLQSRCRTALNLPQASSGGVKCDGESGVASGSRYVLTELGRALREAGSDPDNYVQRVKKLKVMCAASSFRSVGGRFGLRLVHRRV